MVGEYLDVLKQHGKLFSFLWRRYNNVHLCLRMGVWCICIANLFILFMEYMFFHYPRIFVIKIRANPLSYTYVFSA